MGGGGPTLNPPVSAADIVIQSLICAAGVRFSLVPCPRGFPTPREKVRPPGEKDAVDADVGAGTRGETEGE